MKKYAFLLIPLIELMLTGCSETDLEGMESSSQAAPRQLDAQDLAEIAELIAAVNEKAAITDQDMLTAQILLAEKASEAIKITPKACNVFVEGEIAAELEKMNTISVVLPGDTYLEETEVGISSYGEVADAKANLSGSVGFLNNCSEFTLTLEGQEMEMTLEGLKATTSATHNGAYLVVIDTGGTKINIVSVSGIQGSHVVSVSITGGSDTAKDPLEAQERATAVLEMVSQKT